MSIRRDLLLRSALLHQPDRLALRPPAQPAARPEPRGDRRPTAKQPGRAVIVVAKG